MLLNFKVTHSTKHFVGYSCIVGEKIYVHIYPVCVCMSAIPFFPYENENWPLHIISFLLIHIITDCYRFWKHKQVVSIRICVCLMYIFMHIRHTNPYDIRKSAYYHHTVHNRCCNCFVQFQSMTPRMRWLLLRQQRLLWLVSCTNDDEGVNFWDTNFVFQYSMCNHFKRYIYRVRLLKHGTRTVRFPLQFLIKFWKLKNQQFSTYNQW